MKINKTKYNLDMTLILAGIVNGCIVMAADGRARDSDENVLSNNFRKIFQLSDNSITGFAGKGLSDGELDMFVSSYKHIDKYAKYTEHIDSNAQKLMFLGLNAFSHKDDKFWIAYLVAEFITEGDGSKHPELSLVNSMDYKSMPFTRGAHGPEVMSVGSAKYEEGVIDANPDVTDEYEMKDYFIERIRGLSTPDGDIGGDISWFILRSDGIESSCVKAT